MDKNQTLKSFDAVETPPALKQTQHVGFSLGLPGNCLLLDQDRFEFFTCFWRLSKTFEFLNFKLLINHLDLSRYEDISDTSLNYFEMKPVSFVSLPEFSLLFFVRL